MAGPFLNERIDLCARYGTGFDEGFMVTHTEDVGGNEYSKIHHPYPRLQYELSFANGDQDGLAKRLSDLFKKCMGTYRCFRVKHYAEYTTNEKTLPPTALDQPLINLGDDKYQLVTWYDAPSNTAPRRLIRKPVAGSVLIAVGGAPVTSGFTVDYANGTVQFESAPAGAVTGGCEFDIPMRFAADYSGVFNSYKTISSTVSVIEVLNP